MHRFCVEDKDSGKTLLQFLKEKWKDHSLRSLKKHIESKCVKVNGQITLFASLPLGSKDCVESLPLEIVQKSVFEEARVLYEDETCLFYDKPPGIVSDSEKWLKEALSFRPTLCLVHRLDKETSGVLLFAKSEIIKQCFVEQFRKKSVKKLYLALVHGSIKKKEWTCDNYLGKKKALRGQTIYGEVPRALGLHAKTFFRRLAEGKQATLVACYPETGRTHQIRVHLAEMGHPILGDIQYAMGKLPSHQPKRFLLHALTLRVSHPDTGKELEVSSPLPEDFIQSMEAVKCTFSLSKPLL